MAIIMPEQKKSAIKQAVPSLLEMVGSYFGPVGKVAGGVLGNAVAGSGNAPNSSLYVKGEGQKTPQQAPVQSSIPEPAQAKPASAIPSEREAMQMSLNNRMSSMKENSPDLQILEAQKALSTLPPEQRAEYEPYFNQYAELKKRERVRGF